MARLRQPMQGVLNVVRFNWHFYAGSFVLIVSLWAIAESIPNDISLYLLVVALLMVLQIITSLAVSFYVYDYSKFYTFSWLNYPVIKTGMTVLNIHAGFDETSATLATKYPGINLKVLDFYDPAKHTEVSIKRARKVYPSYPGTQQVSTVKIALPTKTIDIMFVTFSAHEIRDKQERVVFFKELNRILNKGGTVIITEHLRTVNNFWAFNIGFFHFYTRRSWYQVFESAGFTTVFEQKTTPFATTFFLSVNVS